MQCNHNIMPLIIFIFVLEGKTFVEKKNENSTVHLKILLLVNVIYKLYPIVGSFDLKTSIFFLILNLN